MINGFLNLPRFLWAALTWRLLAIHFCLRGVSPGLIGVANLSRWPRAWRTPCSS
jgi:hypothetical protein